ncbi:MAG: Gfo/Idh/MocA family protein [Planctomycetota bacterium]|jgi:predicted dehydrogenase
MSSAPIRVGVIGLGFMGGVHLRTLRSLAAAGEPGRTVAVWSLHPVDPSGAGVEGNITSTEGEPLFDPAEVRVHDDVDALLADDEIDAVSICTPTDSHAELVTRAAAAGKHILIEKPVCLRAEEVESLAAAVAEHGVTVMPAMCMRFWPGWEWLRDRVRDGALGPLHALACTRVGAPPGWSADFYLDPARSGNAIVDLHIHDVDFIRWALGEPTAVTASGSERHLLTRYRYEGGPALVTAEGGWLPCAAAPFRMEYRAVFEGGVAEFSLETDPILRLHTPSGVEHPALPAGDGYAGEIAHWLRALAAGRAPEPTLAEAAAVMRLIEAERESLRCGGEVLLRP